MGADNQAEKIISRIERMERMQVEIERLREEASIAQAEIERLRAEIEARKTAAEKVYLEQVGEIERLRALIEGACNIFCNLDAAHWAAEFRRGLEPKP